MPDGKVELSLNPEELGRVRVSLSIQDGGVSVTILADRPETADLMRRHVDQLAEEFRSLGFDTVDFSFDKDSSQNTSDGGSEMTPNEEAETDNLKRSLPSAQSASATGLDIRV